MSETTTNDAELAEIRRRVFYDDPNHDRDPRGEPEEYAPWPQEYADRVALLAEVDRLRALLAAGTPQPTEGQAVVDAAVAFMDHLCAYNSTAHPTVHAAMLALGNAVNDYHHRLRAVVPPPPDTAAAPTTADRHGFWTLNCEGDSQGGRYHLRGDFGRDRDGAWAAYARLLRAPAPATDATTADEARREAGALDWLKRAADQADDLDLGEVKVPMHHALALIAALDRLRAPATADAPTEMVTDAVIAKAAVELVQDCRRLFGLTKGESLTDALQRLRDRAPSAATVADVMWEHLMIGDRGNTIMGVEAAADAVVALWSASPRATAPARNPMGEMPDGLTEADLIGGEF